MKLWLVSLTLSCMWLLPGQNMTHIVIRCNLMTVLVILTLSLLASFGFIFDCDLL